MKIRQIRKHSNILLLFLFLFFGSVDSPAHAKTLQEYVQQTIELCIAAALDNVPLESLDASDWKIVRRDGRDNGNAGKQFKFSLVHTKIPWSSADIAATGIDSKFSIKGRTCSAKYNGARHSYDSEVIPFWIKASQAEISAEFSKHVRNLFNKLIDEEYEQFEEDVFDGEKQVGLRKCTAGVRFIATIALDDPDDKPLNAYFLLRSTDWNKPC